MLCCFCSLSVSNPTPHSPLGPTCKRHNKKLPLFKALLKISVCALARKREIQWLLHVKKLLRSMDTIIPPSSKKEGRGKKPGHFWLCLKAQRSRKSSVLVCHQRFALNDNWSFRQIGKVLFTTPVVAIPGRGCCLHEQGGPGGQGGCTDR